MTTVSEMTLSDYQNIKRAHPDIVIGEATGHSVTLARVCLECEGASQTLIDVDGNKYHSLAGPYNVVITESRRCHACQGKGYVLTPDGKALLQLVQLFPFGVAK